MVLTTFLFLVGLMFEVGFKLAKQVLCPLSHISNPFCFGCFGEAVS
jgi:hypothetical protein